MATKKSTLRERLNDVADQLEKKANLPPSKKAETASDALDRVERALKELWKSES